MSDLKPIRVLPSLDKRESLSNLNDVRQEIERTPKPAIIANKTIELGPCGFGMPVLKSHWTIMEMEPGEILRTESAQI